MKYMHFEEGRNQRAPRRKKRRSPGMWLMGMFLRLLALIVACVLILYALPVGIFMVEPESDLAPSDDLPLSRLNVLLLGVDKLSQGMQRSDTIIVASIGYGYVSMTSILRDTMVNIPGHGRGKINSAYTHGGPELTMRTLNENFGFNITDYAVVDFASLAEIVNAMGGVEIAITEEEQACLNENLDNSWKIFKKLGYSKEDSSFLALDFSKADEKGYINASLDGFQALAYARIRRIDSDFTRAHRQRKLINAVIRKVKASIYNPLMLINLARTALSKVETNLSAVEIVSLAMKAITADDIGQLRMPVEGSYTDDGSALTNVDYKKNLEAFIEFAY